MHTRSVLARRPKTALFFLLSTAVGFGIGCGSDDDGGGDGSEVTERNYVNDLTCPNGSDWEYACASATPRVEVTVKDPSGNPIGGAFVIYYFDGRGAQRWTLTDASGNPVQAPSGTGVVSEEAQGLKQTYGNCTNDEGKVFFCGWAEGESWEAAFGVVKSGYNYSYVAEFGGDGSESVVTKDVTLSADGSAADHKVLVMSCEDEGFRLLPRLAMEHIRFDLAPFPGAVDALVPGSGASPYDTFLIDYTCSHELQYWELLKTEANSKLLQWVNDGGLLFLQQQQDRLWAPNNTTTGELWACPSISGTVGCPKDLFPEAYRYDIFYESGSTGGGCNDIKGTATVVDTDHALVQGVGVDAPWDYVEGFKYDKDDATKAATTAMAWDVIVGSSVDETKWNVILRGPSSQSDVDAAASNACPGAYALDGAVALMEADYGSGKFVVSHLGWVSASSGEYITGAKTDAAATTFADNFASFVKSWQ